LTLDKRSADSDALSPELLEFTQAIPSNMALTAKKLEMKLIRDMVSSLTGNDSHSILRRLSAPLGLLGLR
jgi:hypothetical protein